MSNVEPIDGLAAMAEEDPWAIVMVALSQTAREVPPTDALKAALDVATAILCGATLSEAYTYTLIHDLATDEIGISVKWDDGTETKVANAKSK